MKHFRNSRSHIFLVALKYWKILSVASVSNFNSKPFAFLQSPDKKKFDAKKPCREINLIIWFNLCYAFNCKYGNGLCHEQHKRACLLISLNILAFIGNAREKTSKHFQINWYTRDALIGLIKWLFFVEPAHCTNLWNLERSSKKSFQWSKG